MAFENNNDFSCRPLSPGEWEIYRAIRFATLADSHNEEMLEMESSYGDDYWKKEVSNPKDIKFGLFNDSKIAGMTTVRLDDNGKALSAEFTGLYILEEYRGRKLGDFLFQSSLDYVSSLEKVPGTILTKIWQDNISSQKAAERNGFTHTETIMEDGAPYRIYNFGPPR